MGNPKLPGEPNKTKLYPRSQTEILNEKRDKLKERAKVIGVELEVGTNECDYGGRQRSGYYFFTVHLNDVPVTYKIESLREADIFIRGLEIGYRLYESKSRKARKEIISNGKVSTNETM